MAAKESVLGLTLSSPPYLRSALGWWASGPLSETETLEEWQKYF